MTQKAETLLFVAIGALLMAHLLRKRREALRYENAAR